MEALDQPMIQPSQNVVQYGGFWPRLGALILDGLVMVPVSFGVTYFNITTWKSPLLLILLMLVSLAYKPVMEYVYGATLGKMALNLKVVNLEFERADLNAILMRNIFHIVPPLFSLYFTTRVYADPDFESITGFMQYSTFLNNFPYLRIVNVISGLITIVDAIFLIVDQQRRSLHDRIGSTYVIQHA
jgi:uncharacterized RDD family membrane protein YckC